METKRQKQVAEVIKRKFGTLLTQEGTYFYGTDAFVTVTAVKMSPDLGIAKVYLSVFNVMDKQTVILEMEENLFQIKQSFYSKIRKNLRRMPELQFYLDDTLDEMYRLNHVFHKLRNENQMGSEEVEEEN
ncbi:MAG: 30S ribosome-binding factor RbfA [Bacteroidetes bacterium]|jgi:ribosome-binding factor A|nr:30S ribosome-binding factor RbfA [Bacteroidota bacterium]MDF1863201.1 30S ribosome-binding factor RbfA [Saprospiraceae bacterium]